MVSCSEIKAATARTGISLHSAITSASNSSVNPDRLTRPRQRDLAHPVDGADHPRHPRGQVGLVLKEVQMAPGLLARVVDLAALAIALRTRKASATREVQTQIQPPPPDIEVGTHHPPRLIETKRLLEEVEIAHAGSNRRSQRTRHGKQPRRTLPIRFSEEPFSTTSDTPTTSYYARAGDGTVLSQRNDSGRRNYLYDGEGSVIGLTDQTGALRTSYTYEPYGHPPNLTSLGDQNPFGYRGAYTAGVQTSGVICGGPNPGGGSYYDAEDGRNTSIALGLPSLPAPVTPWPGNILDDINDVARDAQNIYNEYARDPLKTRGGRIARNCAYGIVIGGIIGYRLGSVKDGALAGCLIVNGLRRFR